MEKSDKILIGKKYKLSYQFFKRKANTFSSLKYVYVKGAFGLSNFTCKISLGKKIYQTFCSTFGIRSKNMLVYRSENIYDDKDE